MVAKIRLFCQFAKHIPFIMFKQCKNAGPFKFDILSIFAFQKVKKMDRILQDSSTQSRLFYLFLFFLVGAFIASSLLFFVAATVPQFSEGIWYFRLSIILQDIFMFFLPAYTLSVWSYEKPLKNLGFKRVSNLSRGLWLTVLVYFFSGPLIAVTEKWNSQIVLPEFLDAVEVWMRELEDEAIATLDVFFEGKTAIDLIMNVLIIAAAAALVEEIFFRGALQQLFEKWIKNAHFAVWITAFIFSAIHFQFYGFFPRLLLGALLGYLFVYTRNLWFPIIFHFLNNAVVVVATHRGIEDTAFEELENMGLSPILWFAGIVSLLLTVFIFSRFKIKKDNDTD